MAPPDHIAARRSQRAARRRVILRRRLLGGLVVVVAGIAVGTVLAGRSGDGARGPGGAASTSEKTAGNARSQPPKTPANGSKDDAATATPGAPAKTSGAPPVLTGSYRGSVPILMYHVVTAPKPGVALPELWVPEQTFQETIDLLVRHGFHGVSLHQVWRAWHGGPGLPKRPVVVSFDDGYLSHYTHARPTLRGAGWPGVLNLKTANVGPGGITKRQVRALVTAGWELDSHTVTHPDLTTINAAQLRAELVDSKAYLKREFGANADFFCYPAGKNNATVRAAVRAAGYLAATTVEPGIAKKSDDRFALPRVRVNGTDSAAKVLAELQRS